MRTRMQTSSKIYLSKSQQTVPCFAQMPEIAASREKTICPYSSSDQMLQPALNTEESHEQHVQCD